ncbi:DsrE family protein [Desulfovibrio ferrophilus]|uniref:Uncharacterized protein n=1 Tax=Desulfovibrio ferrophilus TaxID=241368 RepID=A0A2Z6B0J4_9BACT|nr:DsrE family protein [Desulfovibrio ferrophilus]BBD08975.1 uncharacterized protein DFE_2249 [Desulfovibrio ferrophilus]
MSNTPLNLCLVWSTPHREVALNMVFMYSGNALIRGWWEQVRLILWGPSQPLLLGDKELQSHLSELTEAGVELMACRACAENYGIASDLEALGLNVKHTGSLLTETLKDDNWRVLTI